MFRFLLLIFTAGVLCAAPKRVLYFTLSAGFVHDSIPLSQQVLTELGARSGGFEVVVSEDPAVINAESLRGFDAVFFFTSGELPFDDSQKAALLEFVRGGKGFGGVHSATDTLYAWPEYGDLIGAIFDGHPWAQEVGIRVEDGEHPATRGMPPYFRTADEIYQFREFSRGRVHVLLSLDTATVDLNAPGVNRRDGDFALAWSRDYGAGRVFYTALGHAQDVWRDTRFQNLISNALVWLSGGPEGRYRLPRPQRRK